MAAQTETFNKEQVQEKPLKYKIWNLKASIHCEGCSKKIKKILLKTDGVYTVDVDRKQQKVTVAGNVEAETLLKKLNKSGKHAELWPEKPTKSKKNKEKSQSELAEAAAAVNEESEKEKSSVKVEVIVKEIGKDGDVNSSGTGSGVVNGKVCGGGVDGAGVPVKEVKFEVKNPEASVSGNQQSTAPESEKKAAVETEIEVTSGSNGKKKKKKGQNGKEKFVEDQDGEHNIDHTPASTVSPPIYGQSQTHFMPAANYDPPHQPMYQQYPPYLYGPPVHAVSYSAAPVPNAAYTSSYYTAPPPPYSHAYSYAGSGSGLESPVEAPFSDYESYHPHQRANSFELFSDENPNSCGIM